MARTDSFLHVLPTLLATTLLATVAAGPASAERFVGFRPAGEVYVTAAIPEPVSADLPEQFFLCRFVDDEVPASWPPGLPIKAGDRCAMLSLEDVGVEPEDFVRQVVAGDLPAKKSGKSPWGIDVALSGGGSGDDALPLTVTLHASGKVEKGDAAPLPLRSEAIPVVDGVTPRIALVQWRTDGRAVAITLSAGPPKTAVTVVRVVDVGPLLVGGPAGHRLAVAREADAQKALKKSDWRGAAAILDEAIVADPSWAKLRYLRAAAEAQGGIGLTAMIENLAWLKAHVADDVEAKALLAKASNDRAFDAWVGEADIRALIGLPPVTEMTADERLMERSATWTKQGATCGADWLTMVFQKNGKGRLDVADRCKGKKGKKSQPFTWKLDNKTVTIATKPLKVAGSQLVTSMALDLEEESQRFALRPTGDGDDVAGFEPGGAHVDDER